VTAGSFSGAVNLSCANTAADESALALTTDGKRIYYMSGAALMTADLTNAKTIGTPAAVTVNGIQTVNGLAFASDGSLYVAGADATGPQIFKMTVDSATSI